MPTRGHACLLLFNRHIQEDMPACYSLCAPPLSHPLRMPCRLSDIVERDVTGADGNADGNHGDEQDHDTHREEESVLLVLAVSHPAVLLLIPLGHFRLVTH